MKRSIKGLSVLGMTSALLVVGILISGCNKAKTVSRSHFKDFSLGQTRLIAFNTESAESGEMTEREILDQARDWLLFTVLSASDLSADQINQSLYDLPAIRRGYMRPVANFEYGEVRSCYFGDGNVVALVPADDKSDKRLERIARVADEHRKNTGEMPKTVLVFEYKIALDKATNHLSAELTRRETLDARELFTKQYSYQESKINGLADLQKFMDQVDDITFAHLDGPILTLGGRKVKDSRHPGVQVEDVAALWQSEDKIKAELKGFNDVWEKRVNDFNNYWTHQTYRSNEEKEQLIKRQDQEWEQLQIERSEALRKVKLVSGSGFSLDPTYDFDALKREFDEKIAPRIESRASAGLKNISPQQLRDEIREASSGLAAHNKDQFLDLLDKVSRTDRELADSIEIETLKKFGFQTARYDGQLKGTGVGMTLFYTDLMAKLWGWDYSGSAPRAINDFKIKTDMRISPIYQQELRDIPNTRIWFGPQRRGFQKADGDKSLLFAHTSTRIFSASSNPLRPGIEVEPNALNLVYIGWWDDHYEEVARFEPEYERLNEIMKWSLLIGWLNQSEQGERLSFLKSVPVGHSYWFPEWVKNRPELKWQPLDNLFFQKGYKGTETEALPVLESKRFSLFGNRETVEHTLSGGVSLASKDLVKESSTLSGETEIGKTLRRSNLNYESSKTADDALQTLDGTRYKVSKLGDERGLTMLSAKAGAKLRGEYSELANREFERAVYREGPGLHFDTRTAGTEVGELEIARTEKGFDINWQDRDIGLGQSLGRRLSRSTDLARELVSHPDVEMCVQLPGDQNYMVKLRDSDSWLKVSSEQSAVATDWQSRVADTDSSVRNIKLSWINQAEMKGSLGGDNYLLLPAARRAEQGAISTAASMEPPAGARATQFRVGDMTVNGQFDPQNGATYFKFKDLPQALQNNPEKLLLGWQLDARIEVTKLNNGSYRVVSGGDTQTLNAPSMSVLLDTLTSHQQESASVSKSLLLELNGFTEDEATGLLRSVDLKSTESEGRSAITSILRGDESSVNTSFKTLSANYDFAQAKIGEPEISVVKDGPQAGMNQLKMSAEIPAKVAGKQSFWLRMRMLFKEALSRTQVRGIKTAVRRVLRIGLNEDSQMDMITIGITKELRKLHPKIKNIHTQYKGEILDVMSVRLHRMRMYDQYSPEDCRTM
jgi:hypothetical protein